MCRRARDAYTVQGTVQLCEEALVVIDETRVYVCKKRLLRYICPVCTYLQLTLVAVVGHTDDVDERDDGTVAFTPRDDFLAMYECQWCGEEYNSYVTRTVETDERATYEFAELAVIE